MVIKCIKNKETSKSIELSYRNPMYVFEFCSIGSSGNYPICPRCKQTLDKEYLNYCYICGQKLSWKYFSYKKSKAIIVNY